MALMIQFYTKENCALCDEAFALLKSLQIIYPFDIEMIDIYADDALLEKYQLVIPAVRVGEVFLDGTEINDDALENALKNS